MSTNGVPVEASTPCSKSRMQNLPKTSIRPIRRVPLREARRLAQSILCLRSRHQKRSRMLCPLHCPPHVHRSSLRLLSVALRLLTRTLHQLHQPVHCTGYHQSSLANQVHPPPQHPPPHARSRLHSSQLLPRAYRRRHARFSSSSNWLRPRYQKIRYQSLRVQVPQRIPPAPHHAGRGKAWLPSSLSVFSAGVPRYAEVP